MNDRYFVRYGWNTPRKERDFAEEYEKLFGPDGFECCITEPEDRNFSRDLQPIVQKLNEQDAQIAALRADLLEYDKSYGALKAEVERLKAENERLETALDDIRCGE